jgi:hypothetical protein
MKKTLPAILAKIVFVFASCASADKINPADTGLQEYAYIHDGASRVAQIRLRKLNRQFGRSSANESNLATGEETTYATDSAGQKPQSILPRPLKKIKIVNNSAFPVYADLIASEKIDGQKAYSVREIVLPRNAFVQVITVANETYSLRYSWEDDGSEIKIFEFKPEGYKTIRIGD